MIGMLWGMFKGSSLKDKIFILILSGLSVCFIVNSTYNSIELYKAKKEIRVLNELKNEAELKAFKDESKRINENSKKSVKNYESKKSKSNEKINKELKRISKIDSVVRYANDSTKQFIKSEYKRIRAEY